MREELNLPYQQQKTDNGDNSYYRIRATQLTTEKDVTYTALSIRIMFPERAVSFKLLVPKA